MTLSIRDSLRYGWDTFKARPRFFLSVSLLILAISVLSSFAQNLTVTLVGTTWGDILKVAISLATDIFLGMGTFALYLKAHDDLSSPSLRDLWHPEPFWRYLGTNILVIAALLVGYVLLIVPGLILSVALYFATILVIDRGLTPIEAFKESMRITKGYRWKLFLFLLASLALNLLGLIALVAGLLVTIPVTLLAMVHIYRTLSAA